LLVDAYSLLASIMCLSKSFFHSPFLYLFVIASPISFICTLMAHGHREDSIRMLESKSWRARLADRFLGAESRSSRLRGSMMLSAEVQRKACELAMETYLPSLALQRMFLAMVMLSLVPLLAVVGVFLDMPAARQQPRTPASSQGARGKGALTRYAAEFAPCPCCSSCPRRA